MNQTNRQRLADLLEAATIATTWRVNAAQAIADAADANAARALLPSLADAIAAEEEAEAALPQICKPLTPQEAQDAYNAAEPVPLPPERIEEIAKVATGPGTPVKIRMAESRIRPVHPIDPWEYDSADAAKGLWDLLLLDLHGTDRYREAGHKEQAALLLLEERALAARSQTEFDAVATEAMAIFNQPWPSKPPTAAPRDSREVARTTGDPEQPTEYAQKPKRKPGRPKKAKREEEHNNFDQFPSPTAAPPAEESPTDGNGVLEQDKGPMLPGFEPVMPTAQEGGL